MRIARFLLHICFAAATLLALPAHADAPPVEAFFDNPEFGGAALSPSGKYVAARVGGKGARERLAVYEIATGKAQVVAQFNDADVGNFQWISDDRILFDSAERDLAQGDIRSAPGLFAVNRDGTQFKRLAERRRSFVVDGRREALLPWHTFMMPQGGKQNSEYAYVANREYQGINDVAHVELLRLNTLTGRTTTYDGPRNVMNWWIDYDGEPRLALTSTGGTSAIYYRDPKRNNEWRKIADFARYTGSASSFEPLTFGPDGTLYVRASAGQDMRAVYAYDFDTNRLSERPVVRQDDYDFRGHLIFGEKGLRGVRFVSDAEGTQWLDPAMQAVQDQIDQLLQGTVNVITVPRRPETANLMVKAYSDRQAPVYFIYNGETRKLIRVGDSRPQLKASQMATREMVRYQAHDGLSIPAWLTVPKGGAKNLPMVVLVHGGPWVRGSSWAFDDEAQFLASRGYVVLQPEFRGSTGFGEKFFRAGLKQWGLKMQDDIADGVKWAVAQGYADSKRVCIAGASYGGYAVLMGLINDPDLYRCGVNWVGVTDIELMYKGSWTANSDLPDSWKRYGMPEMIGDLNRDAEQLQRTSPLQQAARIKQPLLLAYGGADLRVPIYHGKKFYSAIKPANDKVEWIEYEEEGHGWVLPKNRFDFWKRVEKFLDRNIGAGAKTE
jgi:dipeptidyl aminopeptidase/acylaminoacyl peptidase